MRQWYRVQTQALASPAGPAGPAVADIYIYDAIGASVWDEEEAVSARQFVDELQALPESVKTIRVHVNSPGGSVFDAIGIANALRAERETNGRRIDVTIDGLAASAASIVIMAGNTITIADNAMVMVHNPWAITVGNADEHRKTSGDLDAVRQPLLATYKWHSPLTVEELGALLDAETWMDAEEALENGFATAIAEGLQAAASLSPRVLAKLKVPEKYRDRITVLLDPEARPTNPLPAAESYTLAPAVLRLCREAGCPELAEELVCAHTPMSEVQAAIGTAQARKRKEQTRTQEIAALCKVARLPQLADGYINGSIAVAAVRSHLSLITALVDMSSAHIDTTLHPDDGHVARRSPLKSLAPDAVYGELNRPRTP